MNTAVTLRATLLRFALITLLAGSAAARAADEARTPCTEDAMIVFDASGSMAGNTVQGLFSDVTRIDEVRKALAQVLPSATKFRKVGLITYGPGPYAHCNVELDFAPMPNAAERIMSVVNAINPAGKTPLVEAVKRAAEVLAYHGAHRLADRRRGDMRRRALRARPIDQSHRAGQLTVHVIGFQLRGFSWTGAQSILDVKCLAEETGGLYITAENRRGSGEGVREDARLPHDVGHWRRVALNASSARCASGCSRPSRLAFSGQAGLMTNAGLSGLAITSGRCGVATLTSVELLARSRFKE